ncbi:MAG: hypothetical protein B6I28_02355 [Fusobacteriia bacterium 4572_132]|nr:MAG: hypothetical protein B6I28_02355 [Fusobacteriia bacterium 4572_132]
MRKTVLLFFIILNISSMGFEKFILKKEVKLSVPLKIKEKGNYNIKLSKLNYPITLEEKEKFYEKWNIFIRKSFLEGKKYTFLIDLNFYNDYLNIEKGELLESEKILSKIASSLTKKEKEELKKMMPEKFEETVQGYLNRQICLLMMLNKSDYEEGKQYTELEKEERINIFKNKRKNMMKILKKSEISFVLSIDDPYEEEVRLNRYYYTKDIILTKKEEFNEKLNSFKIPIYISNLTEKDLKKLEKGEKEIKNTYIILNNKIYSGYQYINKRFLIYSGGKKIRYEYPDYKISIEIENVELEELLQESNEYRFKDVFGGE